MHADQFLPVDDVSDTVATVVEADATSTWESLLAADLLDVGRQKPLVGLLVAARALPDVASQLLRGGPFPRRLEHLTLEDTTTLATAGGGWVLIGQAGTAGPRRASSGGR